MCSDFESILEKKQSILHNTFLSSTIVPTDAFTAGHRCMERLPRKQSVELRKRAKLNFVLMYVITSKYESRPSYR